MTGPGRSPRRGAWRALLAAGLAAAGLAALLLLGPCHGPPAVAPAPAPAATPPAAPVAEAAPPPRPAVELRVAGVRGQVERSNPGGPWFALSPGDQLLPDQQLRTGPGAGADLSAGERSHLTVGERTVLAVRELSEALHRYRVDRGVVAVDYLPDGDRLVRIEGLGTGSPTAQARAARFHVVVGDLSFAVATETGGVSLTAGGATVEVPAGQTAHALAGGPPSQPADLSAAVLLKVARASRLDRPGPCPAATGQTSPGAVVTLNDVEVPVGPDGRFPIRGLRAPRDAVLVRAVLPDGRTEVRTIRCPTDDEARIRDLRVRWKNAGP